MRATSASRPYGLAGSVAASITTSGLVGAVAHRAQQVERAWHRELGGAKTGDEVAATDAATLFHRFQHGIDDAEPAGVATRLRVDSRVRMPCRLRSCCATAAAHVVVSWRALACAAIVPRAGRSASMSSGRTRAQRPSAEGGTRRRERNAGASRFARRRDDGVRPGEGAERVNGVVRDEPLPDEVPECVRRFPRGSPHQPPRAAGRRTKPRGMPR